MQIVDCKLCCSMVLPFPPVKANQKQVNQSIVQTNLRDIQASLSAIQANQSSDFPSD